MKIIISEEVLPKKTVVICWKKKKKKDLVLFASKLTNKIPKIDPNNAKEHYKLILKNQAKKIPKASKTMKNPSNGDVKSILKTIKQSNLITQKLETIFDIESVTIEHLKTATKLY